MGVSFDGKIMPIIDFHKLMMVFLLGGDKMLKGRHLLDPSDFSIEELSEIFDLADSIINDPVSFS